ncbi:Bifunctional polymyxin resistance protein ArnA [subsurface metagenome]
MLNGKAPRIKQDKTKASYRRLRTDQESFVNWNLSTKAIYNLVRAVSFPYPKAWTLYKGDKIKINHGSIIDFNFKGFYFFEKPGTIIGNIKGFGCLIKTRDGIIAIDDLEPKDISLLIGDILGK